MRYLLFFNRILISTFLVTIIAFNFCLAGDYTNKDSTTGKIVLSYGRDNLLILNLLNLQQVKVNLSYGNKTIYFPSYPSWSSNGKKILFAHYSNNKGNISVIDYQTNRLDTLIDTKLDCDYPSWSPDNKYIVFLGRPLTGKSDYHLYMYSFEENNYSILLENPVSSFRPTWSPDNSKIAFSTIDNQLVIYDLVKGQTYSLIKYGVAPCWSPDGKFLLYRGCHHVYLYDFESKKNQRIIKNWGRTDIRNFSWSPGGSYFLFQTLTDRKSPLEVFSITKKKRIKLSEFGNLRGFDWKNN